MNAQYVGVYWVDRREQLPEEEMVIVFHVKHRKAYNLSWGYFYHGEFIEKHPFKCWRTCDVDYWMPIPLLPSKKGTTN